jgi:hypothetical protein
MTTQPSDSCVSTEEIFEGGYDCAGIWEESVVDYLKDTIQAFVWEGNKKVEALRRFQSFIYQLMHN